jgi:hypothetical protein
MFGHQDMDVNSFLNGTLTTLQPWAFSVAGAASEFSTTVTPPVMSQSPTSHTTGTTLGMSQSPASSTTGPTLMVGMSLSSASDTPANFFHAWPPSLSYGEDLMGNPDVRDDSLFDLQGDDSSVGPHTHHDNLDLEDVEMSEDVYNGAHGPSQSSQDSTAFFDDFDPFYRSCLGLP